LFRALFQFINGGAVGRSVQVCHDDGLDGVGGVGQWLHRRALLQQRTVDAAAQVPAVHTLQPLDGVDLCVCV